MQTQSGQPLDPNSIITRVLTWNLGDNKLTQEQWKAEIAKSWAVVSLKDYDILFLCLQEDSRGKYGKLADAIASFLDGEYAVYSNSVEGPADITGHGFSVRAYIYAKRTKFSSPSIRKSDICLKRAVFCTKSSAGVSMIVPYNDSIYQITLIASHLPINTGVADLGYKERIAAVQKTFSDVYDKLIDTTVTKRFAVWAGDLNFRDATPFAPKGSPVDQFAHAVSTHKPEFFRGFEEPDVEFPPTCKMKTCDGKSCPACRNRSGGQYNETCYITESKKGMRQPSHCDRILFNTENLDGEVIEYKSWGGAESIKHSDHNLVYATFAFL